MSDGRDNKTAFFDHFAKRSDAMRFLPGDESKRARRGSASAICAGRGRSSPDVAPGP
jgi:hypothetical protein